MHELGRPEIEALRGCDGLRQRNRAKLEGHKFSTGKRLLCKQKLHLEYYAHQTPHWVCEDNCILVWGGGGALSTPHLAQECCANYSVLSKTSGMRYCTNKALRLLIGSLF